MDEGQRKGRRKGLKVCWLELALSPAQGPVLLALLQVMPLILKQRDHRSCCLLAAC